MAAIITIDRSQYRDLVCKLGKKNYINTVVGKEYKIDTTNSVQYEEGNKNCAPSSLAAYKTKSSSQRIKITTPIFQIETDNMYLREEISYIEGYYDFSVTGKTITNMKRMKANYTLNYKSYSSSSQVVTSGNYTNSGRVFSSIKPEANRPEASKDNDYDGSTSGMLPHEVSKSTGAYLVTNYSTSPVSVPSQYCTVVFRNKVTQAGSVNPVYYFRVNFRFVISSGWLVLDANFWGTKTHHNNYHEVQNITIQVNGFSVETEEVDVSQGGSDQQGAKILELQTNELMQSSTSTSSLLFDDVAAEIIEAYKANRLIVSFNLVNNKKYIIDGEERYLQAGDIIKIKGMDDKYLQSQNAGDGTRGNDFEIIKANSKYEGFYYREIVAKEILNSNS